MSPTPVKFYRETDGDPHALDGAQVCVVGYGNLGASMALNHGSHVDTTKSGSPGLVCRNLGRELMYLLFVIRGPRSAAMVDWPSFWTAVRTILRTNRNERYYNWRSDDKRVFFADCFYTLRNNLFKAGA